MTKIKLNSNENITILKQDDYLNNDMMAQYLKVRENRIFSIKMLN